MRGPARCHKMKTAQKQYYRLSPSYTAPAGPPLLPV